MGEFITPNKTPSPPQPVPQQKVEVEVGVIKENVKEPIINQNKVSGLSKPEILTLTGLVIVLLLIGVSIGYYIRPIVYNPPTIILTAYQNKLHQKIVSIDKLITKEQSQEDIDSERIQRLERNRKIVAETLTNCNSFQKTNNSLIDAYVDNQTIYLKTNGIFLNKTK
jgi:hypothetical protein